MSMLGRKRCYGGKRKTYSSSKKKVWYKGSALTATGPFQSRGKTEEYGTFNANGSGSVGLIGTDTIGYLLNGIVAGTAANSRIGEKVINKSIEINYWLIPGVTQTTFRNVRVMVIYNKLNNQSSAMPGASDFINTDSTTGFIEPQVQQKFTVLYNKMHNIGPSANSERGVAENVYRKISLDSVYVANSGTLADISGGALIFCIFGDNALSGTTSPSFQMSSKLRYIK